MTVKLWGVLLCCINNEILIELLKENRIEKIFLKSLCQMCFAKTTNKKTPDECAKCFLFLLLYSFAHYESTVVLRCLLLVEEVSSGASNAASLQAWTVL